MKKEIVERFFKLEETLNLFDQHIQGLYFWERMRLAIFTEIQIKSGLTAKAHHRQKFSKWNNLKIILNSLRNFISKNPLLLAKKSDIMIIAHHRRKLEQDGYWWDIYTDLVAEKIEIDTNYSTISLEFYHDGSHLTPAKTDNLFYFDYLTFRASIKEIYLKRRFKLKSHEAKCLDQLSDRIKENFGVIVDVKKQATKLIIQYKSYTPLYRQLLDKIKPSVVILLPSYANKLEFLIDMCKLKNIPTIELQHGIISPYQLGYSYGKNKKKRCFVDYLYTFGEFWKSKIEFPIQSEYIIPAGFPYFDTQVEKYSNFEKSNRLVVISQGPVGKQLSTFVSNLCETGKLDVEIIYKLHPGEVKIWKDLYPWLLNASEKGLLTIIEGDKPPLYELFATSKFQLGVSSVAIYEGLGFGLKSFLLKHDENSYLEYLIDSGLVTVVEKEDELIHHLNTFRDEINSGFNRDYIFNSNALETMVAHIGEIINKH